MAGSSAAGFPEGSRITVQFNPSPRGFSLQSEVASPLRADDQLSLLHEKIGELTALVENQQSELDSRALALAACEQTIVRLRAEHPEPAAEPSTAPQELATTSAASVEPTESTDEQPVRPDSHPATSSEQAQSADPIVQDYPEAPHEKSRKMGRDEIRRQSLERRTEIMRVLLDIAGDNLRLEAPDVAALVKAKLPFALDITSWRNARTRLVELGCVQFEKPSPIAKRSNAAIINLDSIKRAIDEGTLLPIDHPGLQNGAALSQASEAPQPAPGIQAPPMSSRVRKALELEAQSSSGQKKAQSALSSDNGGPSATFLGHSRRKRGKNNRLSRR